MLLAVKNTLKFTFEGKAHKQVSIALRRHVFQEGVAG